MIQTSAIVLALHGLVDGASDQHDALGAGAARYAMSVRVFSGMLDAMKDPAVCTAADLASVKQPNIIVITFDDGLISDYEIAFKELSARGLKATFFVNTSNVGKPGYCTKSHLCEMSRAGMEIGSHGQTHNYLVTMPREDAATEICDSKKQLEDLLGVGVLSFAAVGGHYRNWMVEQAADSGYRIFATMIPGRTPVGQQRILLLRRNHIQAVHGADYIARVMRGERNVLAANRARYMLLSLARRVLGMSAYDHVRSRALSSLNRPS